MGQVMTRRRLFWLVGATAVVGGLPLRAGAARAATDSPWLRRSGYAGRLGERFEVDGRPLTLRLTAVGDLEGTTGAGRSLAGRDDAFYATLRGPRAPALAQGVHGLSHPELGRASLFLVPGERRGHAATYQLVVNRAAG
jgi:hypothetical protein